MKLENQIYRRKSCRKYSDEEISTQEIEKYIDTIKALNPDINYYYEILTKKEVSLKTRWSAPYYLALYSRKKENYKTNLGFIFQQACLYMQSIDIGNCWVGMETVKNKNPEFVILIAFGKSEDMTRDISKFKRKKLSEISDVEDEKLKPAQYAPSAINSQPWYFTHTDEGLDIYKTRHNIIKRKLIGGLNNIDIGIALSHLYVANEKTFQFELKNKKDTRKGTYMGSIKI